MTKDKFLTGRWNNIFSLGLGAPLIIYIIIAVFTPVLSDFSRFIGISIFGAVY